MRQDIAITYSLFPVTLFSLKTLLFMSRESEGGSGAEPRRSFLSARDRLVHMRILLLFVALAAVAGGEQWKRHVVDDSSRGADGVRLADVNSDGFADIATGWEEGGQVRVYLNPGPLKAGERWPAVTVGRVASPEDAVLVDLDGDGAVDVVSSCEGDERRVYVHWAPRDPERFLEEDAWRTEALPAARDAMRWMFALPLEVDFRRGLDLVAGAKGEGARIGWFEAPAEARKLAGWRWHPIYEAGWIMSLIASDMDADGDQDVLASDRKGPSSGSLWLENPGPGERQLAAWEQHRIGGSGEEVMFLTEADLDEDGLRDVVAAVRPGTIVIHWREDRNGEKWNDLRLDLPPEAGAAKGVAVGDVNLDGQPDIVFSCEHAGEGKSGVMWFSYKNSARDPDWWEAREISGPEGEKFDRVELVDLDSDGDLDVLTCEETTNLGVIWYENPVR